VTILGKALDFLRFASTFFKRAVKNVWHITSSSALRRKNVFEIFCDAIHTFLPYRYVRNMFLRLFLALYKILWKGTFAKAKFYGIFNG
jgi:hypothetical protein